MKPQSRSKLVFTIIGMALASLVVFGIALSVFALLATQNRGIHAAIDPPPPLTAGSEQTSVIHGKGLSPETHVPFHLSAGNEILVEARINGKLIECMVDTGSQYILWNAKLALTDQRTGFQSYASDAGNHVVSTQEAILDRIQIGGLELRQIPTEAVVSGASHMNSAPILGNSAFDHTVLTINYVKRELVICPSKPSDKLVAEYPNGCVLDFQWNSSNVQDRFGSPCIRGGIMSLPSMISVDTGWGSNDIGLTRTFYGGAHAKLKATSIKISPATSGFAFGKAPVTYLSHIFMSFGNNRVVCPAVVTDNLGPRAQAVFGYDTLRHFKTTIDYPHQKIRFQPI